MKNLLLALLLSAAPAIAQSTVHVITDPVPAGTTHCGFVIDALAPTVVPVTPAASIPAPNTPPAGTIVCYLDITTTPGGQHTIKANIQVVDPLGMFPTAVSGYGNVVPFTVPAVGPAPANERLIKP